jgi:hypothetical protein
MTTGLEFWDEEFVDVDVAPVAKEESEASEQVVDIVNDVDLDNVDVDVNIAAGFE